MTEDVPANASNQSPAGSGDWAVTNFAELTPAARAIWAKSGEPAGHGLLAHILDVAAVAERLLNREPHKSLARMASFLPIAVTAAANPARTIASFVGLHDLGKSIAGFQNKWAEGRLACERAGLPFTERMLLVHRHDLATAVDLPAMLLPMLGRVSASLSAAVAAHHGHFFSRNDIAGARQIQEPQAWVDARREIFASYWSVLRPQTRRSEEPLPTFAASWLAGLTSTADWIASNPEWFSLVERGASLADHHARSLELADAALDAVGWPAHRTLSDLALSADQIVSAALGDETAQARPLQRMTERLLKDLDSPALLIIEAPMGEGKTEAAFIAFASLQAQFGHRGLYVGLPTQATSNAMFDRVLSFMRAFGTDQPLDLQLAHGGAMLDERLIELRGIGDIAGTRTRSADGAECVASSAWFSQRRRALLSPYGVGTIDQALFATLNVKHHFVRLWGLSNRVVVLDEVHAYDTYTGGLIESLLVWLKQLGCSVVLMSATLPAAKRAALVRAWGCGVAELPAEMPYPRAIAVTDAYLRTQTFESRPMAVVALRHIAEDLSSLASEAIRQVADGGCGAVVVNTVDRAQALYSLLKDAAPEGCRVSLFHARFPADERSERERDVVGCFGKSGPRPDCAILVATQVVEQSLDIDFDFMLTDLAPADLLLQRAGRLHRHQRPRRPSHRTPLLIVAGLDPGRRPELKTTAWGVIYGAFILLRTWAFLSTRMSIRLPEDIDDIVQSVYGTTDLPEHVSEADRVFIEGDAFGEHLADIQSQRTFAANASIDSRSPLDQAYVGKPGSDEGSGIGARNQTRLGDQNVTVVPIHVVDGQWRIDRDGGAIDLSTKPSVATARALIRRQVKLSRFAIVRSMSSQPAPPGMAEHPWLRDCKPLLLVDGTCEIGSTKVRLDPELGIVYEKRA